jgi:ABC-type Fe3+-hydroxamate transport system substrate-binding protein
MKTPNFIRPPQRVVSLVPSMTENVITLGFGDTLVARTEFCVYPANRVAEIPMVGGTKNPDPEKIIALKPDLVLANQEENTPEIIRHLEDAGLTVWLTFPQTIQQALEDLRTLTGFFQNPQAFLMLDTLEREVEWMERAREAREDEGQLPRVFCPIWQDETNGQRWWMTFNQFAYPHDVVRLLGGENVFAERERRYPLDADLGLGDAIPAGERDTRYPRVTRAEVLAQNPDYILLPTEPYAYSETDLDDCAQVFAETNAVKKGNVYLVDGSLLTWHGTRLGMALRELGGMFSD